MTKNENIVQWKLLLELSKYKTKEELQQYIEEIIEELNK